MFATLIGFPSSGQGSELEQGAHPPGGSPEDGISNLDRLAAGQTIHLSQQRPRLPLPVPKAPTPAFNMQGGTIPAPPAAQAEGAVPGGDG